MDLHHCEWQGWSGTDRPYQRNLRKKYRTGQVKQDLTKALVAFLRERLQTDRLTFASSHDPLQTLGWPSFEDIYSRHALLLLKLSSADFERVQLVAYQYCAKSHG